MPRNRIIALQMLTTFLGLFIWALSRIMAAKLGTPANPDLISIILLLILGTIMGFCFPVVKSWLWGVSAVIFFPLFSLYEAAASLNPHNLLPFEFIVTYPYLAAFVIIGASLGKWTQKTLSKQPDTPLEPPR
jgi:hypothetical protein